MRLPPMPGAVLLWLLERVIPEEDCPPSEELPESSDEPVPWPKSMFEPPEEAPPAEDVLTPALPERFPKSMTTRYGTGPPSRENTS